MKRLFFFFCALSFTAAINAQVTVSNVVANDNGTPYNTTDDYITFYMSRVLTTMAAPYTYSVTAVQGGSPTTVSLADGTSATNIVYTKYDQQYKLPAGSVGKGNVTVTFSPNWTSVNPLSAIVIDPGSVSVNACVTGSQTVSYTYLTPYQSTNAENIPVSIPKFNTAGGRTLTGIKVDVKGIIYNSIIFENGAKHDPSEESSIFFSYRLANDFVYKVSGVNNGVIHANDNDKHTLLQNTGYPAQNIPIGDGVITPGDANGFTINGFNSAKRISYQYSGLDIRNDPDWVTNTYGPTADDDMFFSIGNVFTDIHTYNYNSPTDLASFIGATGDAPIDYTTAAFFKASSSGGNMSVNPSTKTQVEVTVTYTYTNAACYAVSGAVFHDIDGAANGINNLNGVNTNLGLNAVLVDADGIVVDVVPVNTTNGTFALSGAKAGSSYKVIITTNTAIRGSTAPAAKLPDNWVSTGEQNGTGTGNDGLADANSASFTMPASNVTHRDFGIEQLPETQNRAVSVPQPAGGSIPVGTITSNTTSAVLGNDPDGNAGSNLVLGNSGTIVITSLANNGVAYYSGTAIQVGQEITNFDPTKLSFTGLAQGTTSAQFGYAFRDAAGKDDPSPATYTVSWPTPLPVIFGEISATISGNQLTVNFISEKEINNDHFDVEASRDGINFTTIGTVASKSKDGNSDADIRYEFKTSSAQLTAGLGTATAGASLAVMLVLIAFSRRNKMVKVFVLIVVLSVGGVTSCSKNNADILSTGTESKLWIRIAQVDKDGVKRYSKTINAINK